MFYGLLIILLPLTLGYFIHIKNPMRLHLIHRALNSMVYVILFFMGITLALLDNLSSQLFTIFVYAITFFVFTFTANLIALIILDKCDPWSVPVHKQDVPTTRIKMIIDSVKLCGVLVIGVFIGLFRLEWFSYADKATQATLILLLFLVGIQLRNSGMRLKQILLNRRGMLIAFIVAISALAGGAVATLILGLPIKMGLTMSSGFGWYSLTGIIVTDGYGPVIGSAALFNDLAREIAAIILIPLLINKYRATALGVCGSTSMDFALPVLQRSGGIAIVPAAIVHGFLLSLLTPILMAFFLH